MFFKDDFLVTVDGDFAADDIDLDACEKSDPPGSKFVESLHLKQSKDVSAPEETKERACDSLIMCIVTTLNQGLRNGGGIGDVLRAPSSKVKKDW